MGEQVLDLAGVDGIALRPVVSPLPTLLEAVRDVMTDRPPALLDRGERRRWRRELRAADVRALSPFRELGPAPGAAGQPNEVAPCSPGATIGEELARIAAVVPDRLSERIESGHRHGRPTGGWQVVRRQPERWLADYVAALRRLWPWLAPHWRAGAGRIDHEVERLEAARTHRAGSEVLAQLLGVRAHPKEGLSLFRFASHSAASGTLTAGATLDLVPLACGPVGAGWADDNADLLLSVRYPAPAVDADAGSLEALLGRERAALLRALERPLTAGRLAQRVFLSPSGLTHQARELERAGLITRTRAGRHVRIGRTPRAERLLALYGA
jgi:DNA-binding transcriptional ArsR family regulator